MKVLWISNRQIVDDTVSGSGSWIVSMAESLSKCQNVKLFNVTEHKGRGFVAHKKSGNIEEWVLPRRRSLGGGLHKSSRQTIESIIHNIEPDIIHIWGTESLLGMVAFQTKHKAKTLLEIQGVLLSCYDFYIGDLHIEDFWTTQPKHRALFSFLFIKIQKYRMYKRLANEKRMWLNSPNIAVQSKWVENRISLYSPQSHIYHSVITLRKDFLENANSWTYGRYNQIITVGSEQAYKGIHVSIKAFSVIKKYHPDMILKIVGSYNFKKGYGMYLKDLIESFGLRESIVFTGSLNCNEIIDEYLHSSCCVISSFVESYSLVLAEAMAIGIPSVASYSGAMVELGGDESVVYYTPNDYIQCANAVLRIIESKDLALKMSSLSSRIALLRNCTERGINNQLGIYNSILQ